MEPYKLSVIQQSVLIPYYGIASILNPSKTDLIASFGDVSVNLKPNVLKHLHDAMKQNESGRQLLINKPMITEDLIRNLKLNNLDRNTFGYQYHSFMKSHDFSADARSHVRFMINPEYAYVMLRYRQIHDFWHILSGLPPTLLGEIALKCYEYQITGLPICFLSGFIGQLKLQPSEIYSLHTKYIPWVLRTSKNNSIRSNLMSYYYEENFHKTLQQVQNELDFEPAPLLN